MIKVAFIGTDYSSRWMGGVNYITNLLYAVSQIEAKKIEPIVFLGYKVDRAIYEKISPYAHIVQDTLFDKGSFKWYLHRVMEKLFHKSILLAWILYKYDIKVVSHSDIKVCFKNVTLINWIPDFQHLHLPHFFTQAENELRDTLFADTFKKSDTVIVSSYDAYKDAVGFAPEYRYKVKVLRFVSQPNEKLFSLDENFMNVLEQKYSFKGKFYYLPNQFWRHKNHLQVFEAVKYLRDLGIEILVLCTGQMYAYADRSYIESLQKYLSDNALEQNIKLLGLIDYEDVLYLMRYALAVINPSRFEGWSSTVEECKSIGKNMIISDIPIHQEQNPQRSVYFDLDNVLALADILKKVWEDSDQATDEPNLQNGLRETLKQRTLDFGASYQQIVLECIKGASDEKNA